MASFASLVVSQDFSGAVKLLDAEINETRQDYAEALHKLVQLHLNRGICNQKLHLNRKALKVSCSKHVMHAVSANLPPCVANSSLAAAMDGHQSLSIALHFIRSSTT